MRQRAMLRMAALCVLFTGGVILSGCSPAGANGGGGGSGDSDGTEPGPLVSADAGGPYAALCENPHITFDASATADPQGEISVFRWDPGDGSEAVEHGTALSPEAHTYPGDHSGDGPAEYTVTLEVVDVGGTVLDTHQTVARIRERPVAAFTCPEETEVGVETEFDAGDSTDGDDLGYVAEYLWDFDFDGEFSETTVTTDAVVTHVFYVPNAETTVALKVVDDDGFESEVYQDTIEVNDSGGAVIIIQ
ncbi:MAG: PKD domain-containing protein [Spirochaetaceae bacterium]